MSGPEEKTTSAERQKRELAASLEAAAEELERNGPVSPSEVRRTLLDLYAELGEERAAE